MKTMKSILALLMAISLVACLALTVSATEATTTAATDATTTAATEAPETTEAPEATEAPAGETGDDHAGHNHEGEEAGETEGETETPDEQTAPAQASVWRWILVVLEVIASVALILVVVMQSGKESGLGNAISGNSDSYMNKNKTGGLDKFLASATKWIALAWVIITILLVVVVKN